MKDYIIVGSGIAGICFAEHALQNNKSILVINDTSQNASKIAGGLYNPVILKRFSEVWKAQEQINYLTVFYAELENKLNVTLDYKLPIYRKLFSVEEQNNWFVASDKKGLSDFLASKLHYKKYKNIAAHFGYGEVLHSGFVDTKLLLNAYQNYLLSNSMLLSETFDYSKLEIQKDYVVYKNHKAKNIVFAEGFGMLSNPFFKQLPLDGTKGELLIIKAPKLDLDVILKTSLFILPLGNDLYKVGATYNWEDKTAVPTASGKQELIDDLKEIIQCDFEIIEHLAGVRPTVKDRRPMLGTHPKLSNLHLLNGLGTRGVMLGPSMAKALFEYIEFQKPLDTTIDIKRFKKILWD